MKRIIERLRDLLPKREVHIFVPQPHRRQVDGFALGTPVTTMDEAVSGAHKLVYTARAEWGSHHSQLQFHVSPDVFYFFKTSALDPRIDRLLGVKVAVDFEAPSGSMNITHKPVIQVIP